MGAKKQNGQAGAGTVLIKTKWGTADDLPTIYANNLMVSHANQNEFFLFFGQLTPPLVLDPKDSPKELEIVPVAKIVVTPEVMSRFSKAIMTNVENFMSTKSKQENKK